MKNPISLSRTPVGNDNNQVRKDCLPSPSLLADIVMGTRFFSRLPVGNSPHETPSLSRMAPALSLVSIIIALIPALVFIIGFWLGMPALLAATLGIAAQVVVGGGMAEDGLADSIDGLFGGHTLQKRLEIMKDSTHGTYGVLAIVLLVAARLGALSAMVVHSMSGAIFLWIASQVVARQCALWLPLVLDSVRETGTAQSAGKLSKKAFSFGMIAALLIATILGGVFVGIAGLIITAAIVMLIILWWTSMCKRLVGGYSGDLIGAAQALVEIGALSSFILFI